MSPAELKKLVDVNSGQAKAPGAKQERDPLEAIIAAVENFDYREADLELGRIVWLTNPRDVVHRVALPLMRLAGQRWHDQRIRVAHEHLLTQLLANLMGSMIRVYAPVSPPARVMTATLSGDLHAFGVLAASMLVVSAGLAVLPLGPDLPPDELAYAAKRSRTRVVLVSLTSPPDPAEAAKQVSLLAARLPRETELWVGLNPAELARRVTFQEKKIRILTSFEELEHELKRIGGRF